VRLTRTHIGKFIAVPAIECKTARNLQKND